MPHDQRNYRVPPSLRPQLNGTTHIALATITSATLENGRFSWPKGRGAKGPQLTKAVGVAWPEACRLMRAMAKQNGRRAAARSNRKPLVALAGLLNAHNLTGDEERNQGHAARVCQQATELLSGLPAQLRDSLERREVVCSTAQPCSVELRCAQRAVLPHAHVCIAPPAAFGTARYCESLGAPWQRQGDPMQTIGLSRGDFAPSSSFRTRREKSAGRVCTSFALGNFVGVWRRQRAPHAGFVEETSVELPELLRHKPPMHSAKFLGRATRRPLVAQQAAERAWLAPRNTTRGIGAVVVGGGPADGSNVTGSAVTGASVVNGGGVAGGGVAGGGVAGGSTSQPETFSRLERRAVAAGAPLAHARALRVLLRRLPRSVTRPHGRPHAQVCGQLQPCLWWIEEAATIRTLCKPVYSACTGLRPMRGGGQRAGAALRPAREHDRRLRRRLPCEHCAAT